MSAPITRRSRVTGASITLAPDGGGEWRLTCNTHGATANYPSRRQAATASAAPQEWCSGCERFIARGVSSDARRFRLAREALGLHQAQLAHELGLDPQTVSRLERGEIPVRPLHLLAMEGLAARRRS